MKPIVTPIRIAGLIAAGLLPTSLHADEILAHPTTAGFRTNNAGTSVTEGPRGPSSGRLFIGRSYYTEGNGLAHMVVPFQLPDLGEGTFSEVRVSFSTNTSQFDESPPVARDMNLWAMPDPRPFAAPLATDVNGGGKNHTQLGILVKANFLSTTTDQAATVTTDVEGAEGALLADWLNQAYQDGDRAGDFVFMRLSPAGLTANSVGSQYEEFGGYGFNIAVSVAGFEPRLEYTFTPVNPAIPTISSFTATPLSAAADESVTLSWTTGNEDSLTLDPGGIDVTGLASYTVSVGSTTTYTLTASNLEGSRSRSVTVAVRGAVGAQISQVGDVMTAIVGGSNSSSHQITISKPDGVQPGDVMIAAITKNGNTNTNGNAPASGWTGIHSIALRDTSRDTSTAKQHTQAFYRVVDGSEGEDFSFTIGSVGTGAVNGAAGAIVAFTGVDATGGVLKDGSPGGPFAGRPGTFASVVQSTTSTANAINVSDNGAALIMICGAGGASSTWSNWTSSNYGALKQLSNVVRQGCSSSIAWTSSVEAGDSGNATANIPANSFNSSFLIALKSSSVPFQASAATIDAGESTILTWDATGANSVTIDGGVGSVPAYGSVTVSPASTTTYTLTAIYPTTELTARVTVTVLDPISPGPYRYYRFQPLERRNTNNTFIFVSEFQLFRNGERLPAANAYGVGTSYDNGVALLNDGNTSSTWFDRADGKPYGFVVFDMGSTTQIDGYRIATTSDPEDYDVISWRVDGSHDTVNWKTIDVQNRYPISGLRSFFTPLIPVDFAPKVAFSASPSNVPSGGSTTLSWNVTGADSVSIEGIGDDLPNRGSSSVLPTDGSNTYTLTASNGLFGITVSSIGVLVGIPAVELPLENSGFDQTSNLDGVFVDGARQELDGWQIIARQNTAVPQFHQVAVGSQDILPVDGDNVLRLMAGAAIGQETAIRWSELSEGDQITLTVAAGDRGNEADANPRWADESFFGFTNGLAQGAPSSPTADGWILNLVSASEAIGVPPGGFKSGTMGDVSHSYTVGADDHKLDGSVAILIASLGYRDGSSNGTDAPGAQSFWDRVRLEVVRAPGPFIASFTASETMIKVGDPLTLSWNVEGADEVSISDVGSGLPASGTIAVSPGEGTSTYTLSATNAQGLKTRSVSVRVFATGPAVYRFFRFTATANRQGTEQISLGEFQLLQGDSVMPPANAWKTRYTSSGNPLLLIDGNLSTRWEVSAPDAVLLVYAQPMVITGYRLGTGNGSSDFDPSGWRLEGSLDAYNWSLIDERSGEVLPTRRQSLQPAYETFGNHNDAVGGPSVGAFEVSAAQIREGESVTLSWTVSDASSVSISGLGTVASTGTAQVTPTSDTTYYLIAENAAGRTIASASVQVESLTRGRVIASFDDGQFLTDPAGELVSEFPEGETFSFLEVGRYRGESDLRHIVIPFQLPDLGAGRFTNAELVLRVSGGELGLRGRPNIQLFALPEAREDSLIEPFDVVNGADNHLSNGILIDPLFLNTTTPLEQFIGSGATGTASQRLAFWLNEAYAGGANAGKFVFLRLSANALQIPEGFSFAIATGDDIEESAPAMDIVFDPQAVEPSAPTIGVFDTLSPVIGEGDQAILQWSVSGASSVEIDQGVGSVSSTGSIALSPSATTTYTLTASSGGTPVTASAQVTVAPAGTMRYVRLTGQSARGGVTLNAAASDVWFSDLSGSVLPNPLSNWSEAGPGPFSPVVIDFGGFYAPASYRVASGAGSYLNDLTAWRLEGSLDGRSWLLLDERGNEADDIPQDRSTFSDPYYLIPGVPDITIGASKKIVKAGESFTLSWNVTNTDTVTIDNDIGTQPASGSLVITPSASATYTYTVSATGADITVTKSISVLVLEGALLGTTYEGRESELDLNPISNLIAATPSGSFLQTGPISFENNFFTGQPTDLPGLDSNDSFSVLWLGWFDASVDGLGNYTFGTNSDDGSVIYFDLNDDGDFNDPGELIVDNNGNHGTQVRTGTVNLQRNLTRIAIAYYEAGGDDVMEARFKKGAGLSWESLVVINANTRYFQTSNPLADLPAVNLTASTSSIVAGQSVTLSWNAVRADAVTISGIGAVAASGTTTVNPTTTTTYTLTASNAFGERDTSVTVTVGQGGLVASTYDTLSGSSQLAPISNLINATPSGNFVQITPIAYADKTMFGSLPGLTSDDTFSVLWQGWIDVSLDGPGVYTFATASKEGSAVYIDLNDDGDFNDPGELIVDNYSRQAPSITSNPACDGSPNFGWFTKSGGTNSSPTTGDIRQLVIRWNGETVYNGPASGIANGSVTVGDYRYYPSTYRATDYGWCDSGACGTCSSNADFGNSFDVSRSPATGYDGTEGGTYGTGSVFLSAPRRIAIGYSSGTGEEIMHARFKKGSNLSWSDLDSIGTTAHFQPNEPSYQGSADIIVDTTSLAGLSSVYGSPSSTRSFTLYGVALGEGIRVEVASPFEVSTSSTSGFASQINVGGAGDLQGVSIYVRIAGSAAVGTYESGGLVSLSSAGATSESVTIGSSSIGRATLQVTANVAFKTYGDADPELTYTSSGLIGTDDISGSLTRAAGENAGVYAINSGSLDAGSNYELNFTGADFTITPKALGSADITLTRDGNAFTASADGVSGFTYSYVGRDDTSYGPSADAPTNDGEYTVTATVDDPNFTGSKSEDYTIGGGVPQDHPAFKVTSITMVGSVCTMVWESQPDASYTVEASDNPADPQSWSALMSDVASQGSTTTMQIDLAETVHVGAAKLFMRVKALEASGNQ